MSDKSATPRPWRVEDVWREEDYDDFHADIVGADGCNVWDRATREETEANAKLAVRSVNQSDHVAELVRLAQYIIDHPHAAAGMGDIYHSEWDVMQRLARTALAPFTKEQP